MLKTRIIALLLIVCGVGLGIYVYQSEQTGSNPFRLGLDLSGGSYLVYKADVSEIDPGEVQGAMDSLRDIIEERINTFGVAEPNVQTESSNLGVESREERLIVELPGVTDLEEAIEIIGQTPLLEFKVEASAEERERILAEIEVLQSEPVTVGEDGVVDLGEKATELLALQDQLYVGTELTGKYLEKAQLQFSQAGIQNGGGFQSQPIIGLRFSKEGAELFETLTRENVGKTLAIYLDGQLISAPVVNTVIAGGDAVIEGNFTLEEAKEQVARLNSGALPIPIELISTNTIGPTLGQDAVDAGVSAGFIGLVLVSIMLILWYRIPGLIATVALALYTIIMLWIFKFIPVTLTSAGIVGFIISIGMAVDANILIFERMKEELASGESLYDAVQVGFKRAWASINDANILSFITAIFLFWFGTTLIKGFALTFGIGIIISVFSAVSFSRYFLLSFVDKKKESKIMRFLFSSGFNK